MGVESTVVDMTADIPTVLRPGGMPVERIREAIGDVLVDSGKAVKVSSPGQLDSHYAPRIPLFLSERNTLRASASLVDSVFSRSPGRSSLADGHKRKIVALVFDGERKREVEAQKLFDEVVCLSEVGAMSEAAASLFSLLHDFDGSGYDAIFAETAPDFGLGRAINDRLHRASRK